MWSDAANLASFYDSHLGETARQLLRVKIRGLWPSVKGDRLAGFGFASPYMQQFAQEAASLMALMPAAQGSMPWPEEGPNKSCLVKEGQLPLPDLSLDRVLMVHGLEHALQPDVLLREIWRVLRPEGSLLIVVPSRRGLWARVDTTPFGWGRPFSRAQIEALVTDMLFTPMATQRALFVPPTQRRWLVRSAATWERIGTRFFHRFGGVILIDAKKRLAAPTRPKAHRFRAPALAPTLKGAAARAQSSFYLCLDDEDAALAEEIGPGKAADRLEVAFTA